MYKPELPVTGFFSVGAFSYGILVESGIIIGASLMMAGIVLASFVKLKKGEKKL